MSQPHESHGSFENLNPQERLDEAKGWFERSMMQSDAFQELITRRLDASQRGATGFFAEAPSLVRVEPFSTMRGSEGDPGNPPIRVSGVKIRQTYLEANPVVITTEIPDTFVMFEPKQFGTRTIERAFSSEMTSAVKNMVDARPPVPIPEPADNSVNSWAKLTVEHEIGNGAYRGGEIHSNQSLVYDALSEIHRTYLSAERAFQAEVGSFTMIDPDTGTYEVF